MEAVKNTKAADNLTELPFDQYSRQRVVAEIIQKTVRTANQKFKVIDLGGHKGKTQAFMPNDDVTIIDVYDETYPNYIKGDATAMTFADDSYDIATSFDVFEHIPRAKRLNFIKEALRVSKFGVFITMPVDDADHTVSRAEETLNELFKQLYGDDHPWLKEHIDYRIPNEPEIESLLELAKAQYVSFASNQITDWQLLQATIFMAAKNHQVTDVAHDLSQWYNKHFEQLEMGVQPGYRRVYFITRDKKILSLVKAMIERDITATGKSSQKYIPVHQELLEKTMQSMATVVTNYNKSVSDLQEQVAAEQAARADEATILRKEISDAHAQTEMLRSQLQRIHASIPWRASKPLRIGANKLRAIKTRSRKV